MGILHRPQCRTAIDVFERRERLCSIIDLPQIVDRVTAILGDKGNSNTSEANEYSGDTPTAVVA